MQIRKARLEDGAKIAELEDVCYDQQHPSLEIFLKEITPVIDEYYSVIENDTVVGNARLIPFEQNLRGVFKKMGGVAMVTSAPEVRNRGYIRNLMQRMFSDMHSDGIACSTLYPFKETFYQQLGYINCHPIERIELNPLWLTQWDPLPKGYTVVRSSLVELQNDICGLHDIMVRKLHGGVRRSVKRWNEYPFNPKTKCVVVYNPQHQAEAFLMYSNTGYGNQLFGDQNIGTMFIYDNYWTTLEGRHGLLYYIYTHKDQIIKVHWPIFLTEPYFYAHITGFNKLRVNFGNVNMARVLDVASCLTDLPIYAETSSESLRFKVEDPHCPWNNHIFECIAENGRLHCSVLSDELFSSSQIGTISIQGITALVYGTLPLDELQYTQDISNFSPQELNLLISWFPPIPTAMREFF